MLKANNIAIGRSRPSGLARVDAEDRIDRAPARKCSDERNGADPAPDGCVARAVEAKCSADQGKAYNDPQDAID